MPEMTECCCEVCGCKFERRSTEVRRSQRRGSKLFCNLSCTARYKNKILPHSNPQNLVSDNKRDEYTPFRWFIARVRDRRSRKGETDLTLEFLKQLWDKQQGRCPLTGWDLELPAGTKGWVGDRSIKRASLDRIDCKKGYTRDNVRFVSWMANVARSDCEDEDLIKFCQAVAGHSA